MLEKSDAQLLRDYAQHGVENAFSELVARHTNLVYSAALRQVDSPDLAAEIAQRIFVSLARDAKSLSHKFAENASLAGWLCRSARNISLNFRRDEFRRRSRERQAMEQFDPNPENATDWQSLLAVLDDAMSELSEPDYDAIVMRFFQNRDFRALGETLGVSDDTAQKRVSRALEKLRENLSRRGVRASAAGLSIALAANAIQAAPVGLAATISAAALAGTTATTIAAATVTKTIIMTTLQKA
jgi:RNA polymerase sigma factor (sigma-70 family)